MKKPIIPIIAIATVIIGIVAFSFADFETSVDIPKTSDTGEAGDNVLSDGTLVTVVEVTDKSGEVVATEQVTFSKEEVKFGQDFFAKPNEETILPSGILPDRLQALTTTPDSANTQTTVGKNPVSNTDKTTSANKPVTQTTTASGNKAEKPDKELTELDIIKSQKYYYESRLVNSNGEVSTCKIARDGVKYSAVILYNGEEIGFIINETDIIMVSVAEKTYISVPISMIQSQEGSDELLDALLSGEGYNLNKTEAARYDAKEDGVIYNVIEYTDGSKDYLYDNLLIKTVTTDNAVQYYDVITNQFPASVFFAPAGYQKQELTDVGVSEFAEDVGMNLSPATQTHSHDE